MAPLGTTKRNDKKKKELRRIEEEYLIKWLKNRIYDIRCIVKWCIKIDKLIFWYIKITSF